MTTLPANRPSPSRRPFFLAAAIVAAVAIAAALPAILRNYGPFAGDDASPTSIAAPNLFGNRSQASPDIQKLEQAVKDRPQDLTAHLGLASAYLQAVRESGDPSLYAKADAVLAKAEKLDPKSADVLATMGILALGRHDFARALTLGKQAVATDPERARFYGVVADAQIELGQYEAAVVSLQEMVNRKPDFASYSRISYARELYGDPEGAIDAMELAVEAGSTNAENVAWANVQLGNLYFGLGRHDDAARQYEASLARLPGYALANAGKGQVAAAKGDLLAAKAFYQSAFDRMPLPQHAIALGDIAKSQGNAAEAERYYGLVRSLDQIYTANGANTDLDLALFLADHDISLQESLQKARAGYAAAPSVHAADVLAWTLFKSGNISEAQKHSNEALKLGSRDSLVLFHAGMIEKAAGNNERARELLQQVVNVNPKFSLLYSAAAAEALASLQ